MRCEEDEKMISYHLKANPNCTTLYVVDTRPAINAMVNKAQARLLGASKSWDLCLERGPIEG